MEAPLASHRAVAAVPALALAAVCVADLALGSTATVLGLTVTAPLLASTLVGVRATAAYAVAAVVAVSLLGLVADAYHPGSALAAQLFRLAMTTGCGAAAVAAARYRVLRERRLTQVTKVAEAAQRAILLPVPADTGPVRVAVRYESAASEALVGGDVYGLVTTPYGLRVLLGDVRGKGLDAVRLSSQVLAAFRERAGDDADLAALAARLDVTVTRCADDEDFVTAVLIQVADDGTTTVVNAGHPPPLLRTATGTRSLEPEAFHLPLGLGGGKPTPTGVRLATGDRLLAVTDGLTEARSPDDGTFLPRSPVEEALAAADVEACLDGVRLALLAWSGQTLTDDVAMVLLEYAGKPLPFAAQDLPAEGVLSASQP